MDEQALRPCKEQNRRNSSAISRFQRHSRARSPAAKKAFRINQRLLKGEVRQRRRWSFSAGWPSSKEKARIVFRLVS